MVVFAMHSVEMLSMGSVDGEDAGVPGAVAGAFLVEIVVAGLCFLLA